MSRPLREVLTMAVGALLAKLADKLVDSVWERLYSEAEGAEPETTEVTGECPACDGSGKLTFTVSA